MELAYVSICKICGPIVGTFNSPHRILAVVLDRELSHQLNNCKLQRLSFQVSELELSGMWK